MKKYEKGMQESKKNMEEAHMIMERVDRGEKVICPKCNKGEFVDPDGGKTWYECTNCRIFIHVNRKRITLED